MFGSHVYGQYVNGRMYVVLPWSRWARYSAYGIPAAPYALVHVFQGSRGQYGERYGYRG